MNKNRFTKFYSFFTVQIKRFCYVFLVIPLMFAGSEWTQLSIMLAVELTSLIILLVIKNSMKPSIWVIEVINRLSMIVLV
jgi:hypothetical protein